MLMRRSIIAAASVGLIGAGIGMVSGQEYPSKSIGIITAGVGGGNDMQARIIQRESH